MSGFEVDVVGTELTDSESAELQNVKCRRPAPQEWGLHMSGSDLGKITCIIFYMDVFAPRYCPTFLTRKSQIIG